MGSRLGCSDGESVGTAVGSAVGIDVGVLEGIGVGCFKLTNRHESRISFPSNPPNENATEPTATAADP